MICERCGEHEAELKVSRVDRDRVVSLNLCAGCGRSGLTDAWWLRGPAEEERPGRGDEGGQAVRAIERERVSED
jgi:hypothetical protein